ncbi:Limulus clotting factor C, partial [Eufriesea mexicana]
IEHGYAQCSIEKFQCKNGQCIASELLCDGRADCRDMSDETFTECSKPEITCPDYAFRCSYGACVDGDATCNGIKDCIDNSDETLSRCTGTLYNATTLCAKNQFKCNNGQCIAESGLCDGIADCTDYSDETFNQCGSLICPQLFFRCHYGACIDGDLKCNGVKNCADGSDEDPKLCRDIASTSDTDTSFFTTTTTTRTPPIITTISAPTSCVVPQQPKNGYWKLHKSLCCTEQYGQPCEHCDVLQGIQLPPGAYLVYKCNPGYRLSGSSDVFCSRSGKWSRIPVCTEIRCEGLESVSTLAECTYENGYISCINSVPPQTRAILSCRPSYNRDTTLFSRSEVTCNKNGTWEPVPMQCIPVCGVQRPDTTPLIVHGTQPKISEFPWHATLYRANNATAPKEFICGATIIHESLLVTAAHCVYDDNTKQLSDPSLYYVKNMYMVCTYFGFEGNYAGDIAILEITEPFTFSSVLVPICLDINNRIILDSGSYGKVAGFGRTALGSSSYILQSITVPYVPFNQCKSSSTVYETEKYITDDKFCAGYTNGSSVCDGDSGGGLVFYKYGLWYLKGIVSVSLGTKNVGGVRICDSYSYSLYTRVSNHLSWIQDIIFKFKAQKPISSC